MRKGIVGIGTFLAIVGIALFASSLISVPFTSSQLVQVPHSEDLFNKTISVPPGHYTQSATLVEGRRIHIDFEVTSGGNLDINFFVADEVNYYKWKSGETASVYLSNDRITSLETDWIVPYTDKWYFVYDNSFSLITSKEVSTYISEHWVTAEYQDVTENHTLLPSTFSYVGILLAIVGSGIIIAGIALPLKPTEKLTRSQGGKSVQAWDFSLKHKNNKI